GRADCFFYFRDRAYAATGADFAEDGTPEEVAELGHARTEERARSRRRQLGELKQRIRASGVPLREDYADPQALGELVHADLAAVLERRFPAAARVDSLDRQAAEHDAFARGRVRVYVERDDDFAALEAHVNGDGPPLVLVGESGIGKSALLANWALRHIE